jgi:hypothetical protein
MTDADQPLLPDAVPEMFSIPIVMRNRTLPEWASSRHEFVYKQRIALETHNGIEKWVDAVFGSAAQGQEQIFPGEAPARDTVAWAAFTSTFVATNVPMPCQVQRVIGVGKSGLLVASPKRLFMSGDNGTVKVNCPPRFRAGLARIDRACPVTGPICCVVTRSNNAASLFVVEKNEVKCLFAGCSHPTRIRAMAADASDWAGWPGTSVTVCSVGNDSSIVVSRLRIVDIMIEWETHLH